MANSWFRMYAEFADDPKVQMMPETYQRRLVMLFCDRCKGPIDESHLAFHWRIDSVELQETKKAFLVNGFIDEQWNVLNWDKRQFLSDSSTPRVALHRSRTRSGLKQGETLQKRSTAVTVTAPEQIQNRTETEKAEPDGSSAPAVRREEFANAWNRFRGSLPRVEEFSDSRRKKVQARIRQGVTVERFAEAVRLCTTMPFLLGTNERGWVATFDWLIENDRNIAKVLEGNYKREGVPNGFTPGPERYKQAEAAG